MLVVLRPQPLQRDGLLPHHHREDLPLVVERDIHAIGSNEVQEVVREHQPHAADEHERARDPWPRPADRARNHGATLYSGRMARTTRADGGRTVSPAHLRSIEPRRRPPYDWHGPQRTEVAQCRD